VERVIRDNMLDLSLKKFGIRKASDGIVRYPDYRDPGLQGVTAIGLHAKTLKLPLLVRFVIFFSLFVSAEGLRSVFFYLILLLSKEGNSELLTVFHLLRYRNETLRPV